MKIALIISINFRVAHISHLVASYRQMEDLGFRSICLVHPDSIPFLPNDINYVTEINGLKKIAISIFWFPSLKNISTMLRLKYRHGSKILYVFHEPVENFSSYIKSGNSFGYTCKFFLKYYAGLIFLCLSDRVLLPSNKALKLYKKGLSRLVNSHTEYMPLMFSDERSEERINTQRRFISYIGGISKDHAFDEFIDFIYKLFNAGQLTNCRFLIATRDKIPDKCEITELQGKGMLQIISGKPLTNDEINRFYEESVFVWNAYNRSTQSGVLAKAFMFGTPAIVSSKNLSEFVEDGREVVAVRENKDFDELLAASIILVQNNEEFAIAARHNFERNYNYPAHNARMRAILCRLGV